MASDEGGGLQREQQAIADTVRQAVLQAPAGSLLAAIYPDGLDPTDEEQVLSTLKMHDVPEVRQGFLRTCQDAVALAGRGSAQDGAAYRALILQVSQAVAQAAKEGGFLGLGGVQVSGKEQDALEELARAVGGTTPTMIPAPNTPPPGDAAGHRRHAAGDDVGRHSEGVSRRWPLQRTRSRSGSSWTPSCAWWASTALPARSKPWQPS